MVALGVSWNQWFPSDLSAGASTTIIELDVRGNTSSLDMIDVKVGFEDYERRTSFVQLNDSLLENGQLCLRSMANRSHSATDAGRRSRPVRSEAAGDPDGR